MKIVFATCVVLLFTLSGFAEDNVATIENSLGYANLTLPTATGLGGHHSGFATETDFNLTRAFGLDNYLGVYGLGQGVTLVSDFFGGKIRYSRGKVVPYAVAGLGIGYFSVSSAAGTGSASAFATRFGGGVTGPITDSLSWKAEYSRMNFHLPTTATSGWTSGNNLAGGIVFTLN